MSASSGPEVRAVAETARGKRRGIARHQGWRGWSLLLLASWAAQTQAQVTAPQGTTPEPYRLQVDAPLVLVDASVAWRKTGMPLPGLKAGDFDVTEDGQPQRVLDVSQDVLPLSLLFLFDLTDTVHPVLQHLSNGAAELLRHLRPGDEVAVMTFSSHIRLEQRFTRDPMSAIEGIDAASASYDAHEPTFLFEDLWQASQISQISHVADARRVQVWITDGSANDQTLQKELAQHASTTLHTERQAAEALWQSNAVVSALIERSNLQGTGRFGDIEHFAEETGGPVVYATATDAAPKMAALLESLPARYTLAYRPAQARPAGSLCRLQVSLSVAFRAAHPEMKGKDVVLRARQSYMRAAPVRAEPKALP